MAGLPRKNYQFEEQFTYSNGAPKEGTRGYFYLQDRVKEALERGYIDGVKFTIEDIAKRLKPIVYMQIEEDDKTPPLPEYADTLSKLIKCLTEYVQGLKTQINNLNRTNFREGTRALILRCERIMGEPRGNIINPLLRGRGRVTLYKENRGAPPGGIPGAGRPRTKKIVEKQVNPEDIDPTDLLKNEEVEADIEEEEIEEDTKENKE